jgi:hypothetical protein
VRRVGAKDKRSLHGLRLTACFGRLAHTSANPRPRAIKRCTTEHWIEEHCCWEGRFRLPYRYKLLENKITIGLPVDQIREMYTKTCRCYQEGTKSDDRRNNEGWKRWWIERTQERNQEMILSSYMSANLVFSIRYILTCWSRKYMVRAVCRIVISVYCIESIQYIL